MEQQAINEAAKFCVNCKHWVWLSRAKGVGGCLKKEHRAFKLHKETCEDWSHYENAGLVCAGCDFWDANVNSSCGWCRLHRVTIRGSETCQKGEFKVDEHTTGLDSKWRKE
jgi:hypothetical protein